MSNCLNLSTKNSALLPKDFINLQIASSEAIVNAIVHGNKEDPRKKVFTEISYNSIAIVITIQDEGGGFDLSKLPDPTAEEIFLKKTEEGFSSSDLWLTNSIVHHHQPEPDSL